MERPTRGPTAVRYRTAVPPEPFRAHQSIVRLVKCNHFRVDHICTIEGSIRFSNEELIQFDYRIEENFLEVVGHSQGMKYGLLLAKQFQNILI